jgi:hypothetical protein
MAFCVTAIGRITAWTASKKRVISSSLMFPEALALILSVLLLWEPSLGTILTRTADGKLATFDIRDLHSTSVSGISPSGAIIGDFFANGTVHGFLRMPNGNITTFDVPTAPLGTYPDSINAAGAITGHYFNASGSFHGFLRNLNGTFETFDVPGSSDTAPSSINASGVVTGSYIGADGGIHGFLRTPDED